MKTYRGRRGIAPLILNLGTDVNGQLHAPVTLSPGNTLGILSTGDWAGPRARLDVFG
jgi:hypothetical protein